MKNKKLLALALLTAFGVSNNISARISAREIKQKFFSEATFKSDLDKYINAAREAGDETYIERRFKKLEGSFNALGANAKKKFSGKFEELLGEMIDNKISELRLRGWYEGHSVTKDPEKSKSIRELKKFIKGLEQTKFVRDLPQDEGTIKDAIDAINAKIRTYEKLSERPQGNRDTERTYRKEVDRSEMREVEVY